MKLQAGLYVVATPIGNLGDITLRALDVLKVVDVVVCEDTRVTGRLLQHYGIQASMVPYHDHSDAKDRARIIKRIECGQAVALCSDAGTPMIADPGYKLVRDVQEAGLFLTSLPGASAMTTAITLAGLPSDRVVFQGFLPVKVGARKEALQQGFDTKATQIWFERASRVPEVLAVLAADWPQVEIAIVREISKQYETVLRGMPDTLLVRLNAGEEMRGEVVLVVAPLTTQQADEMLWQGALREVLKHQRLRDAVDAVAGSYGIRRREVYQAALLMQGDKNEEN